MTAVFSLSNMFGQRVMPQTSVLLLCKTYVMVVYESVDCWLCVCASVWLVAGRADALWFTVSCLVTLWLSLFFCCEFLRVWCNMADENSVDLFTVSSSDHDQSLAAQWQHITEEVAPETTCSWTGQLKWMNVGSCSADIQTYGHPAGTVRVFWLSWGLQETSRVK